MNKPKNLFEIVMNFGRADEKMANKLVENLIKVHARPLASGVLRAMKLQKQNKSVQIGSEPKVNPAIPKGPFRRNREGALLVFVPRNWTSRLIDDLSGRYGYSHLAVDAGETDLDTGKPVMIESMTGDLVRRRFLDEYGGRHFARIPLRKIGIDPGPFLDCVAAKVGEKYDYLEALTWGDVDDPARQVCSNLATDCLPESLRQDIIRQYEAGRLSNKVLSLHRRRMGHLDLFMSPNGFCEYFGIPSGRKLEQPNHVVEPSDHPKRSKGFRNFYWGVTLLSAGLMAAWWLRRKNKTEGLFPAAGS